MGRGNSVSRLACKEDERSRIPITAFHGKEKKEDTASSGSAQNPATGGRQKRRGPEIPKKKMLKRNTMSLGVARGTKPRS